MKKGIIIIGKIPPPYFGPAVATKIILDSELKNEFALTHIDTRINKGIDTMGSFSFKKIFLLVGIYCSFLLACLSRKNKLVLLPIAQETSALYKDLVFIVLAKLFRKKVILHLRGSNLKNWYMQSKRIHQRIFRFWFSKCDAGIVLGKNLMFLFEDFLPLEKIYVLPNGGNYRFPPKNRRSEKVELLYFSNLMYNKGLDLLLNAIKDLPEELKQNMHCSVVGSWENDTYKKECLDLIETHQLPVSVFAPCSGEEKFRFFANADVFIFTPRKPEGHPWVLVEALAASLPVISTDQGAITESVINGFNGFIVNYETSVELSEKLGILITDKNLRLDFSGNSRRHYQEHFTEDRMVQELKKLFLELLD